MINHLKNRGASFKKSLELWLKQCAMGDAACVAVYDKQQSGAFVLLRVELLQRYPDWEQCTDVGVAQSKIVGFSSRQLDQVRRPSLIVEPHRSSFE
jgi:hypothetical protein